MFYSIAVTVPAGTTEADPVEEILKVGHGIIHHVEVEFRSGTDFRVGVRILREEHQLYPTNPDNDLKADGRAIIFDDHEEVTDEPYYLKIRAYSPTANYEHVVYVRIGILPSEVVVPFSGLGGALRKFLGYVGVMK